MITNHTGEPIAQKEFKSHARKSQGTARFKTNFCEGVGNKEVSRLQKVTAKGK